MANSPCSHIQFLKVLFSSNTNNFIFHLLSLVFFLFLSLITHFFSSISRKHFVRMFFSYNLRLFFFLIKKILRFIYFVYFQLLAHTHTIIHFFSVPYFDFLLYEFQWKVQHNITMLNKIIKKLKSVSYFNYFICDWECVFKTKCCCSNKLGLL